MLPRYMYLRRLSDNELRAVARDFERVLADGGEQDIHSFLQQHSEILTFVSTLDAVAQSKFRLGASFVPDFVCVGFTGTNDPRPCATFIEIERADQSLFTRAGDPSSFLTHALRQVADWKAWVTNNRAFVQAELERSLAEASRRWRSGSPFVDGFIDGYVVVAGRRQSMNVEHRIRLGELNRSLDRTRVHTYDVLLDSILHEISWRVHAYIETAE